MNLWIARDDNGRLFLYERKPVRYSGEFASVSGYWSHRIDDDLFPEVTLENSPKRVTLKLNLL